jgi:hypothetical protein
MPRGIMRSSIQPALIQILLFDVLGFLPSLVPVFFPAGWVYFLVSHDVGPPSVFDARYQS